MQHLSWAAWVTTGLSARTAAINIPATVEVDLVFPRNETYAPTRHMPFIFAFQNPSPATLLHAQIEYNVWNSNDTTTEEDMRLNNTVASGNASLPAIDLDLPETSSYLVQDFSAKFNVEGRFAVLWRLYWYSCIEASPNVTLNLWTGAVFFSTTHSHPVKEIDLVTSINDEGQCSGRPSRILRGLGKAFRIAAVHDATTRAWREGDQCAEVLDQYESTKPCQARIDDAAAAGIWASVNETMCRYRPYPGEDTPDNIVCPGKKSDAHKPVVGVLAYLLLLFGISFCSP